MKLSDLTESPIHIEKFQEYTDEQLQKMIDFFSDAREVGNVEVDYLLLEKDGQFALQKNGNILGSARTSVVEYDDEKYLKINMIVVLPLARKQNAGQILLHAIKEYSDLPLICDDVISAAGLALFKSVAKNKSVFSLKSLDKRSGEITDFKDGDERNMKLAIILENKVTGLYRENFMPGISDRIYLRFFE